MPTVVKMMQLSAPAEGQKPVCNRSANGALTGKKPAPMKKFKKEAELVAAPLELSKKETPFGTWLREHVATLSSNGQPMLQYQQQTYEYVLEGAPFRGDSLYGVKDQLKEAGARFARNADKKEGCEDKSIKRGWWAAGDDATLFRMLNLERDERGRNPWSCLELGSVQEGLLVRWLRRFSQETGVVLEAAEAAEAAAAGGAKRKRDEGDNEGDLVPDWVRAAANGAYLTPSVPEPTCGVCVRKVMEQFLDCGCKGAKWTRCPICTAIYRPGAPAPHDVCKC